jgi:hypothetical protein
MTPSKSDIFSILTQHFLQKSQSQYSHSFQLRLRSFKKLTKNAKKYFERALPGVPQTTPLIVEVSKTFTKTFEE